MIHSIIRIRLDVKKQSEALQILRLIVERTRIKAGCIRCDVYKSLEDDTLILMEQLWRKQEDLHDYLRSKDCQNLLLVIEMALSEPDIEFNTIISSAGIEEVRKVRNSKRAKRSGSKENGILNK
jgi:quinol monooxygenase YgiN